MAFVAATLSDLTAEAQDWRHRTLEPTYPIIVFERLRMRCRDGAQGANRTCHIAIGYQAHGPKEVLGFWFETNDEHRFWFDVLGDLAERGVEDVIYLVGSSLALGSALEQVFPAAQLIPHVGDFVRQSQDLSTCKNRCTVAKALRPVHGARTMDEALLNLEQFEASDVARSNPSIGQIWRRHWDALSSFFEIAPEIRCVMTSTFAADGLRRALKMALARRKNSVSSEEAATLMYLVARDARRTWKRPQREWHAAKTQLAMQFSDRFC
jgi:putative transposase